jgi:hypothetical protein
MVKVVGKNSRDARLGENCIDVNLRLTKNWKSNHHDNKYKQLYMLMQKQKLFSNVSKASNKKDCKFQRE